jgi:2-amino-4-hydroxy-6-hydroxymethyldihydropteridine diphosphokinase
MAALSPVLSHLRVSSFRETEPVGMAGPQPMFLNGAATGESTLSAPAILDVLLAVEQGFGRERPYERAPRTIDLDLILYGEEVIQTEGLTVPHPRFRERRFVLEPLAEIAPDWIDPVTGKTIAELLRLVLA